MDRLGAPARRAPASPTTRSSSPTPSTPSTSSPAASRARSSRRADPRGTFLGGPHLEHSLALGALVLRERPRHLVGQRAPPLGQPLRRLEVERPQRDRAPAGHAVAQQLLEAQRHVTAGDAERRNVGSAQIAPPSAADGDRLPRPGEKQEQRAREQLHRAEHVLVLRHLRPRSARRTGRESSPSSRRAPPAARRRPAWRRRAAIAPGRGARQLQRPGIAHAEPPQRLPVAAHLGDDRLRAAPDRGPASARRRPTARAPAGGAPPDRSGSSPRRRTGRPAGDARDARQQLARLRLQHHLVEARADLVGQRRDRRALVLPVVRQARRAISIGSPTTSSTVERNVVLRS